MSTLPEQIAELLVVSYRGEQPPREFLQFLERYQVGGVIFFADNAPSREQLSASLDAIRAMYDADRPPILAIDEEGGRVSRLPDEERRLKPAAEYGTDGDVDAFVSDYQRLAGELADLGLNLNFAPVADVAVNPNNECLHGRCFSDDPERAAALVAASVKTAHRAGLLCCLKHFPGLGAAAVDPHHQTTQADYDMEIWRTRERVPFAAGLAAGGDLVMTTHLTVPSLDGSMATASARIVGELLRDDLEYNGPVITDDLTMGGASPLGDYGARSVAALQAGHDILLFGQDTAAPGKALRAVEQAVRNGELDRNRIQQARQRVRNLKRRLWRRLVS
jgi:beta-N-acetylhexosaminidase